MDALLFLAFFIYLKIVKYIYELSVSFCFYYLNKYYAIFILFTRSLICFAKNSKKTFKKTWSDYLQTFQHIKKQEGGIAEWKIKSKN